MRRGGEGGFLTVQFVAVVGMSFLLFAMLAEVLVAGYGRASVRAALDEAVRAAVRMPDADALVQATCLQQARQRLDALAGGRLGDGVTVACTVGENRVVAQADATWPAWTPLLPAWTVSATATALRREQP